MRERPSNSDCRAIRPLLASMCLLVRNLVVLGFVFALPALAIPDGPARISALLSLGGWADSSSPPLDYVAADRWRLPIGGERPLVRAQSPSYSIDRLNVDSTGESAADAAQERLRRWGATYMLLESIDHGASGYRFCCRMSSPAGPDATFEAVDATAAAALHSVLTQVSAWRRADRTF